MLILTMMHKTPFRGLLHRRKKALSACTWCRYSIPSLSIKQLGKTLHFCKVLNTSSVTGKGRAMRVELLFLKSPVAHGEVYE